MAPTTEKMDEEARDGPAGQESRSSPKQNADSNTRLQPQTPRNVRIQSDASSADASKTKEATNDPHQEHSHKFHLIRRKTVADTPVAKGYSTHKYVFRRPRPLQYMYEGQFVEAEDHGIINEEDAGALPISKQSSRSYGSGEEQVRSTDHIEKQRERLDLFIDLLFVGVISNLSEHYFNIAFAVDGDAGRALYEFILLFLPAFRMWFMLQTFLNWYYLDDFIQRFVIVWILILALAWGNNAPSMLNTSPDPDAPQPGRYLICLYLLANNSIFAVELIYSIFIPWIRRVMIFAAMLSIPSIGLWIATTLTTHWTQVYLLVGAIIYDYFFAYLVRSPIGDRLVASGKKIHKAHNPRYAIGRLEAFFTIALGEGVFLLVRGSPLGAGVTVSLAQGILAFVVYYFLHWLYFNGDYSKNYVHGGNRRWWIVHIWQTAHIFLYANLVLLSSGILYIIRYQPDVEATFIPAETPLPAGEGGEAGGGAEGGAGHHAAMRSLFSGMPLLGKRAEEVEISSSSYTFNVATATVLMNLAICLLCMTILALLNRPCDPPGTLVVDNRYVRLAPRMIAVVLLATLWLVKLPAEEWVLGICALATYVPFMWEFHLGMEKGWKFFEPKD